MVDTVLRSVVIPDFSQCHSRPVPTTGRIRRTPHNNIFVSDTLSMAGFTVTDTFSQLSLMKFSDRCLIYYAVLLRLIVTKT
jgi:hypothetical protein